MSIYRKMLETAKQGDDLYKLVERQHGKQHPAIFPDVKTIFSAAVDVLHISAEDQEKVRIAYSTKPELYSLLSSGVRSPRLQIGLVTGWLASELMKEPQQSIYTVLLFGSWDDEKGCLKTSLSTMVYGLAQYIGSLAKQDAQSALNLVEDSNQCGGRSQKAMIWEHQLENAARELSNQDTPENRRLFIDLLGMVKSDPGSFQAAERGVAAAKPAPTLRVVPQPA